jgi:predicted Zn-dependent peptidase
MLVVAALGVFATALASDDAGVGVAPQLSMPHERYTLPNGLEVILAEDHSVPFVWVNVWYHVGSKDEVAGRSGFAHLFEHLMFQGSEHYNADFFGPLQKVGAVINGTTNLDRTNYFEGVPSEHLPLAVAMESDRMGWLLPALDQGKLDNQKSVVRNERRQRYDNVPYGHAWLAVLDNVFPEGHPYHIATIGRHEEIDAASLEDVKAFFTKWYVPNNASLVIAGDFDPKAAKRLVSRYFGEIPAGPEPVRAAPPPPVVIESERVVVKQDANAPFERVYLVWPTPAVYAPGDSELDLASHALAGGKDSRLYKRLVHDKQIAQDVSAVQQSFALQSLYMVTATVAPGHTADEVIAEIDAVMADVRANGFTDEEITIAKTQFEVGFYGALGTIQGKADLLNSYWVNRGDPDWLAEDLARFTTPTAVQVAEAVRTHLPVGRRLSLRVGPPPPPPPPPALAAPEPAPEPTPEVRKKPEPRARNRGVK